MLHAPRMTVLSQTQPGGSARHVNSIDNVSKGEHRTILLLKPNFNEDLGSPKIRVKSCSLNTFTQK